LAFAVDVRTVRTAAVIDSAALVTRIARPVRAQTVTAQRAAAAFVTIMFLCLGWCTAGRLALPTPIERTSSGARSPYNITPAEDLSFFSPFIGAAEPRKTG
jgi:hypothetical protein